MTMSLSRRTYSSSYKKIIRALSTLQSVSSLDDRRLLAGSIAHRSFVAGQRNEAVEHFTSQYRQFSKMPRPIVYSASPSPPSRAVLLAAAAIGVDIEVRDVDLLAGDTLTEEFKKLNPEHTVPTLDDDGFVLWDSHAIICYLADKYGKDDSLYPKDVKRRAIVNQRLYFESGVIFARLRFISFPLFTKKTDEVSLEKMELVDEAYVHLNNFLEGKQWLAGDSYTLADISCVASISSAQCIHPIDKYPNIKAWLKRCEETLPGYETLNTPGCKLLEKVFGNMIKSKGKL